MEELLENLSGKLLTNFYINMRILNIAFEIPEI